MSITAPLAKSVSWTPSRSSIVIGNLLLQQLFRAPWIPFGGASKFLKNQSLPYWQAPIQVLLTCNTGASMQQIPEPADCLTVDCLRLGFAEDACPECKITKRRPVKLLQPKSSSGLLLSAAFAVCTAGFGQSPAEPPVLSLQVPVQRGLLAGQVCSWQITAEAGQFLRLAIRPNGLALKIRLTALDGSEAANISNRADESRTISVSHIAAQTGRFVLQCTLGAGDVAARGFEIRLAELRPAREVDRVRVQAERLFESARTLQDLGSKESLQQAAVKFEATLPLWASIGDKAEESHTL